MEKEREGGEKDISAQSRGKEEGRKCPAKGKQERHIKMKKRKTN